MMLNLDHSFKINISHTLIMHIFICVKSTEKKKIPINSFQKKGFYTSHKAKNLVTLD